VVIEDLIKQYGTLRALGGVSFGVNTGEWSRFMGPSVWKNHAHQHSRRLDTLTSAMWSLTASIFRDSAKTLVRYARKKSASSSAISLVPYLTALEK